MVDSFGGIAPEELKSIFREVKTNTSVPVGFHGHNNLQLGLINTVTAISLGIDYVDVTVLGMGIGAISRIQIFCKSKRLSTRTHYTNEYLRKDMKKWMLLTFKYIKSTERLEN